MGADLICFDAGRVTVNDTKHDLHDYDVAVVQTGWYEWQFNVIKRLQSVGIKVLFNIDDWIKGIGRRAKDMNTPIWQDFTKPEIQDRHLKMMEQSDGILASTPVLADKLSQFNRVGLAPNGVDLHRYAPWRDPVRDDGFIVGWAGGVGHSDVIREIAEPVQSALADLNREGIKAKLCVVGQDERHNFGVDDAMYLRWADKMIYPQYLSCFDVSLAPSRDDSFYRYKSQLRLYEGAALGTPTLGGPLYTEIEGYGVPCHEQQDWYDWIVELGMNQTERNAIRQHCYDNIDEFDINTRIETWKTQMSLLTSSTSDEPQPYLSCSRRNSKSAT